MHDLLRSSLIVVGAGLLSMACGGGGGGGGAAGGGVAKTGKPLDIARCGPDAVIDDGEDGNNQVIQQDGRAGYWYTAVDPDGTTIEPQAGALGGTFTMREGGSNGSGFAACMKGFVPETSAKPSGLIGFNFTDPKEAYDASKYGGIAFWAKKAPDTVGKVRMKIPDEDTDPQGGVCQECFNDFGMDLELTDNWTEYVIMWPDATQMPSWGNPRPPAILPDKLYGVQWQFGTRNQNFDMCFDDIAFVGCGG